MTLTIDLDDEFGTKLPDDVFLKESIGQALIDEMVRRTQDGNDLKGKPFKGYSSAYMTKTGKTNPPDLTLTGDMLDSLDVINVSGSKVKIGFNQSDVIPRAFNHNTGDTLPKREFFGIMREELNTVINDWKREVNRTKVREEVTGDVLTPGFRDKVEALSQIEDKLLQAILSGAPLRFDR